MNLSIYPNATLVTQQLQFPENLGRTEFRASLSVRGFLEGPQFFLIHGQQLEEIASLANSSEYGVSLSKEAAFEKSQSSKEVADDALHWVNQFWVNMVALNVDCVMQDMEAAKRRVEDTKHLRVVFWTNPLPKLFLTLSVQILTRSKQLFT